MAEKSPPAYQRYVRETLANRHKSAMNLEEWGAYDRLCLHIWEEGFLSFDEKELAKILKITPKKFRRLWPAMEKVFHLQDGKITDPDLDEQRLKQAEWRAKSAEGGRKSAESRRKGGAKVGSTVVQPNPNISTSTSPSTSTSNTPPTPSRRDVAANDQGVSVFHSKSKSEFTDEERLEYAKFHEDSIHNLTAWIAAGRDGRFDAGIKDWVETNEKELAQLGTFSTWFHGNGGGE